MAELPSYREALECAYEHARAAAEMWESGSKYVVEVAQVSLAWSALAEQLASGLHEGDDDG